MKRILCVSILAVAGCQGSGPWLQGTNLPLRVPPPATGSFQTTADYSQQAAAPQQPARSAVSPASAIEAATEPALADLKTQDGGWRSPATR